MNLDNWLSNEPKPEPEDEEKARDNFLFDVLNDLYNGKTYLLTIENEHRYNPFMTNKFMGGGLDTVLYAQEMNQRYDCLDKVMQHDFYFYGLRKKKRFVRFMKAQKVEDITLVARYFSCSPEKAKDYIRLLDESDLIDIRKAFDSESTKKSRSPK